MSLFARTTLLTVSLAVAAGFAGLHHTAGASPAPAGRVAAVSAPVNKYNEVCASCHQADGKGLENAIPPLAGAELLLGRPVVPIAIVLHGLQGEVTVKGKKYDGAMMAWGTVLNDEDLAATLTYARSQWGNRATPITAAQVRAVRTRLAKRDTPFTAAELRTLR